MVSRTKISIIGAGFVGASIAYALALQNAANEIVLIDINSEKASGEADDIKHGLCFLGEMNIHAGDYSNIKDSDIIILTAGVNRKPGETRLDLAQKNVKIAKSITQEIMKYYNKGVILVVSNPVDILTYLISKWTGLPNGMVIGTGTTLDSARLRSVLADLMGIDIVNVHGYIIGEHGDTQVPIWSNTHIAGTQIDQYCLKRNIPWNDEIKSILHSDIKSSGASVIKRKGATYFGISTCVTSIVNSIMRDKNTLRTLSYVVNNQFGINDVAISLPVFVGKDGISDTFELDITQYELDQLLASAKACRDVIDACKDCNL